MSEDMLAFAERIRGACLQAARDAYEDAGLSGLCPEGRWEAAQDAIRALPLAPLLVEIHKRDAAADR